MFKKFLIALSFLAVVSAQAQSTGSSPVKKELVARILRAQQPAIEGMGRGLAERPALEIMNSAMQVIQSRVAKDKQEATARDVQADAQKYAQDAAPFVQQRAIALAPASMGQILEDKFSEDELRQIASALENPALIKFQQNLPEMQQALGERVIADTRSTIEPKVRALEDTVGKRLGLPTGPAPTAKAPAKKQ